MCFHYNDLEGDHHVFEIEHPSYLRSFLIALTRSGKLNASHRLTRSHSDEAI